MLSEATRPPLQGPRRDSGRFVQKRKTGESLTLLLQWRSTVVSNCSWHIYRTHAVKFENLRCKMFLKRNQWRAIWSLAKGLVNQYKRVWRNKIMLFLVYFFNPVPFSCLYPTISLFPLLLCLSLSTSLHFHKSPKTGSCHLPIFFYRPPISLCRTSLARLFGTCFALLREKYPLKFTDVFRLQS